MITYNPDPYSYVRRLEVIKEGGTITTSLEQVILIVPVITSGPPLYDSILNLNLNYGNTPLKNLPLFVGIINVRHAILESGVMHPGSSYSPGEISVVSVKIYLDIGQLVLSVV